MTTLTNLAAFVTSNIVKAFQKRLMPAFVSRLAGIQLPSWIGTRFPRGSPESFERIEAWNNSKSFETQKIREEGRRKTLANWSRNRPLYESLVSKFSKRKGFSFFSNGAEKLRISVIIHLNVCAIEASVHVGMAKCV